MNGAEFKGQHLTVELHKYKNQRDPKQVYYTNLFVKGLPPDFTNKKLEELFQPFGEIDSCTLKQNEQDEPCGVGFVNFKNHEDAVKALQAMNKKEISPQHTLLVS
jgi:polyadenylate-binding protein